MEKEISSMDPDEGQSSKQVSEFPTYESQPDSNASILSTVQDENTVKEVPTNGECVKGRRSLPAEPRDRSGNKIERRRRMSTGMVKRSSESLNASESSPGGEATPKDEALNWEDWQEFATPGGPEAVADLNESDSINLLEALEPYVPRMLVHSTLYDPDTQLSRIPTIESLYGAVMIADITGFTTLTERALTSKRGTELVEELLVAMNNYFTEAGEIVLMFGGDIIKYAGDAMIICFPLAPEIQETKAGLALRAASCGIELISTLGVYTPQLGGYGDTLISHDRSKLDVSKMQRVLSRPSSPSLEKDNEIQSRLSVLVVDDYLINRVVLRQMLVKLNCEVMEADNGKEATTANTKEQFDAIFMDVHMPGMDGCLATRIIRQSNRPKTPVIGVCTKYDDDLKRRCLIAGMDQLLVKPLAMSQLVAVLRGLKSGQSQESSSENFPPETAPFSDGGEKMTYRELQKRNEVYNDPKRGDSNIEPTNQSATETPSRGAADAPVILTMKVLVGIGQVGMLSVGGGLQLPSRKPRWEYFMVDLPISSDAEAQLTPKPMEQLRRCEERATPGSVILSPEVWTLCHATCEGVLLADGFVRLVQVKTHMYDRPPTKTPYDVTRVPAATNILKRYLPDMLRSKFEAVSAKDKGAAGARPEVRHVTCLFLCFPGLSNMRCSNSDLLNNVQQIMVIVQRSLRMFDGLLVQFKMDEKGYVMLCAFGLPGNLHEDDPKRGIQTALDVQKNTAALGQNADIGVTTGKLLCTIIGGKKRREYTIFGNCINLSARLMKKANNEVLIDMDTYKVTSGELEVVPLPPLKVKGRTGLIDVHRVVRFKPSAVVMSSVRRLSAEDLPPTSNKVDLCGRGMEMELAMSKIHAFISKYNRIVAHKPEERKTELSNESQVLITGDVHTRGKPDEISQSLSEINPSSEPNSLIAKEDTCTAIVIIGQAGIGKTRLVSAISSQLVGLPLEVLGVGSVNNNMLVYGVWVKLLLDMLPFDPTSSPEERGLIVLKYLDPDLHQYAHLLKDVLKVQFQDAGLGKTQRPKSRMLRRASSEREVGTESRRRISFMANLAAQGALLVRRKTSQAEQIVPESELQTSAPLDSGSGSEVDPVQATDVEDERSEVTSYSSGSSNSTQVVPTIPESEKFPFTTYKRLSVQFAVHRRDSSEILPVNSSSESLSDEKTELQFLRDRRRSSTDIHLDKTSSPEVKIQRIGKLLLNLLLAVAKKPCLIFFEDAHLMDRPSWSVLRDLSEVQDSGILVTAVCRLWGVHAPKAYTALIEAQSTLQLHLTELDEESTEAMIRQKISCALNADIDIPRQVFQAISRRTQGHPLFVEQMVMALVELILISANSQAERKKALQTLNLDTFNFSHSMEALITSRVDLLEPNQGLALKVASVIGLSFSMDSLQSIVNQQLQREGVACFTKQQLEVVLQGLQKLNFIYRAQMDPDGLYSFANSVTRDITYEMLPIKQRRIIHADIAQELLKLGTSGVRCVNIAHHYTMACKDVEEMEVDLTAIAIDHWQEAASSAMFKFGQYRLAIEYYQNAIYLGKIVHDHIDPQRRAKWHFYLGKAYGAVGDVNNSLENTVMALDYLGENSNDFSIQETTSLGCSSSLIARISSWRTECQSGIISWLASVTGNRNEQVLFFICEALAHLSALALAREDFLCSRKIIKRYIAVAKEASRTQPLELARAYSLSAVVAKSANRARYKAQKSYDIVQLQAGSIRPAVQAGDIHFNLAKLSQFQGKWLKAERHASSAQRMYEASQGRSELDLCRCLIGLGQLYQGQLETACETGTKVLEYRHEHPQLLFWSAYLVVACLNSMKRYKDSAEIHARIKDQPCPLPSLILQAKALGWLSAMHLGDERATIEDAIASVPSLLEIVPVTPAFPVAYASAAEVLLLSLENRMMLDNETSVKEKLLEGLVKFFKTSSMRIEICYPFYKFYQARLALVRKKKDMALSLFQEAEKQALKLKMVPQATAASEWFERCSNRSDEHLYTEVQDSYTEPGGRPGESRVSSTRLVDLE